jgi:hypothetical protein
MSTQDFVDDDLENDDQEVTQTSSTPNWRRKLEREAEEGKQAKAEAAAEKQKREVLERQMAFMQAGVDLDSPLGKMFAKGYEGDLTVDAIRTAGSEVGVVPTSQNPVVAAALQVSEQISQASSGAATTPTVESYQSKLDALPWGDEAAVLALVAEQGSEISFDEEITWPKGGNKNTPVTS